MKPFHIELTVPKSAIDAMGHVNNVVYLQWMQDVAKQHWVSKTTVELRARYAWVVVNHFIDYKQPAFEHEVLLLETWVERYTSATSERHTHIRRKKDGQLLVTATTTWCLIDTSTGKPTRIPEEVLGLF